MTLLIVTVVSLLLSLPYVIFAFVFLSSDFNLSLSFSVLFHLDNVMLFFFYANSLVNAVLYAIRMPDYRSALLALFRRRAQQQRWNGDGMLPLREM